MYIDPNASSPDTRPTTSGTGMDVGGMAGSSLHDLVDAATSGRLRVDQATGDATIKALGDIQVGLVSVRARLQRAARPTRLGGGYGERLDRFNQEWAVDGEGSAMDVLEKFQKELEQLKVAVRKSMETYQRDDAGGAQHIARAGEPR